MPLFSGSRPGYLLFMTDGEPTSGLTDELGLAGLSKGKNRTEARLFSFGVGHEVNSRLLDRLSGQAGGISVYVAPSENIEEKVSSFFSKLTSPVLSQPELRASSPINRLIPDRLPDLFSGGQMVVSGRYAEAGQATFTLSGRTGGDEARYSYRTELMGRPSPDGDFLERLWAQRRIGEIIGELDLSGGEPNQELVDELVKLSKEYGILTPYTSFLALERQSLFDATGISGTARQRLSGLDALSGQRAVAQREAKQEFMQSDAPLAAPKSKMAETELLMEVNDMTGMAPGPAGQGGLIPPSLLGGKAFFAKDGLLMDGLMAQGDLEKARKVVQLTPEYFELAGQLEPHQMAWLSQDKPVAFVYRGQSYLIQPAS
jgi:Ca-activated chloride channel family protein